MIIKESHAIPSDAGRRARMRSRMKKRDSVVSLLSGFHVSLIAGCWDPFASKCFLCSPMRTINRSYATITESGNFMIGENLHTRAYTSGTHARLCVTHETFQCFFSAEFSIFSDFSLRAMAWLLFSADISVRSEATADRIIYASHTTASRP